MAPIYRSIEGAQAVRARYEAFLAHWPAPHERLMIPTREGDTFVIASGPEDGPPVLLLHGTAFNSLMWASDVAAWSRRFRVYAVDIIGDAGLSAPSRPPLASDRHAQWLGEVMTALGAPRAALVGCSFGGWLALDFATRFPDRVAGLALLAPGGVGRQKNVLLWALPLLLLGPWGRRKLAEKVSGPISGEPPPAVRAVAAFSALIGKHFRVRTERLPHLSDEALQRLTTPVMARLGGRDAFIDTPGTQRRLLANLPHAEVEVLPDAYHAPRGYTAAVEALLERAFAAPESSTGAGSP